MAWTYEAEILRDNALSLRVIRKSRQIGITTTIAHEAVWKAYTTPNRVILIVSPSDRQSKNVMDRLQNIINANETLHREMIRNNTSEVKLSNGSVIMALPNNPDRLRGFTATDIYLDEAAHFLNDAPVMAAIKPMLIASKGTFTVVSTPYGKRGIFWEQYQIAVNQQGVDPTVRAYDLFPSTISPLITQDELLKEQDRLYDLEYKQEYLGEFVEQTDIYITLETILACVDTSIDWKEYQTGSWGIAHGEPNHSYIMGIDFAKQRDQTVVIILENVHGVLWVRHISAWSSMDYSDQIGRIMQLCKTFNVERIAADQTGVGEALIEDLHRAVGSVIGVLFTQTSKLDMAGRLKALLEKHLAKLPNDKKLIMQLNSLHYEVSKTGNILFASPEKERLHDDYLWALALACRHCYEPEQTDGPAVYFSGGPTDDESWIIKI